MILIFLKYKLKLVCISSLQRYSLFIGSILGILFVILIFFFFKMLTRYAVATSTISTKGTAATGLHFCQQPTPRATTGRLSHLPAKAQGGTGRQWSHFSFYQTIGQFFTTIPTRHFLHSDSHSIVP